MVFLSEERGGVEITGFPPESVSEKAGIKVGDILLSIDQTPVRSIDDVKIELLSKEKERKVNVRVSREMMIGGSEEITFEVTLQ